MPISLFDLDARPGQRYSAEHLAKRNGIHWVPYDREDFDGSRSIWERR